MPTELNPCLCGGTGVWIKLFPKNRYDGFFHCEQCGYETMTYRSKQAAVKAWNKRNILKEDNKK